MENPGKREKVILERFRSEEIDTILDLRAKSGMDQLKAEMLEILGKRLDEILSYSPVVEGDNGTLRKTEIDNVSLRVSTFTSILDALTAGVKQKVYAQSLQDAGEKTGRGFSLDIFNFLRTINKIPWDYHELLNFWVRYDRSAGFGMISVGELPPEAIFDSAQIRIDNSFLVRGLKGDTHKYCSFLQGYLFGLLSDGFPRLYRLLKAGEYMPPPKCLKPAKVEHEPQNDRLCLFRVTFRAETLSSAFDALFEAEEELRAERIRAASQLARTAMEKGLKEKLGIPISDHISFHKMVKSLGKPTLKIDLNAFKGGLKRFRELYGEISKSIHGEKAIPKETCEGWIYSASEFLNSLESIMLTEGQKLDVTKAIQERPSTKEEIEEELDSLREELRIHESNLRDDRKTRAKYGDLVPPHIKHRIRDTEKKIAEIKKAIVNLEYNSQE